MLRPSVEVDDAELDPGGLLHHENGQMIVAEDTGGADPNLPRALPGVLDEILESLIGAFRPNPDETYILHLIDDRDEGVDVEDGLSLRVQI